MGDLEIRVLAELFSRTLAPSKDEIKAAEAQLKVASEQPGYSLVVLQLVSLNNIDVSIRQCAAVNFKNLVKYRWVPSDSNIYGSQNAISDAEKEQIKGALPGLMLATHPLVQRILSEALSIICGHDFPNRWPRLLPELVERLSSPDLNVINGVLSSANSIFKRYRNQFGSDELVKELENSQNAFCPALLEVTKRLCSQVPQLQSDAAQLRLTLSCIRLACRIFYSLNALGLTPLMETQLETWMAEFHTLLGLECPMLEEKDPEKESTVDAVKAAICANINLFMEMNEEEFARFLQTFVSDVWNLLLKVTLKPGQDNLAMAAIRFLTTVARSVHHGLFRDAGALQQICEHIVVPNTRVRSEDEELFEFNPVEYIRRDMEGTDSDTRRRAAADLVRSLTDKFPAEVTGLFTQYVNGMLAQYASNPSANWKSKDCAIYLVLALTVRGKTDAQGATKTNTLVNLLDFFTTQVLPELQSAKVDEQPVLKADSIKFVSTFRTMLPKNVLLSVFPLLITHLGSRFNVVHSYAANTIERLLALKEGGVPKFSPADLGAQLPVLLERLFASFKLPDSEENEYLMRAVMRVVAFVGSDIAPVAPQCLAALASMLLDVCKNPKNPGFNHYLFESVAALIKHGTAANAGSVSTYESMLLPAFNEVLQQDVQEFHPYVFQIFAQLIELHSGVLPEMYLKIFPPLLSPIFWERGGNVPALVRLLQAYLSKAPDAVVGGGHLLAVLGVFQKLVASKAHDHEGFFILNTIVSSLSPPQYEQYMLTVWTILFQRLQNSKTQKFVRGFIVFLSLYICKLGGLAVQASVDRVQAGMFIMVLRQVFLPNIASIDGPEEEKLLVVAVTKCLCEVPDVSTAQDLWQALRDAASKKLEATAGGKVSFPVSGEVDEDEGVGEEVVGTYAASYARLAHAAIPERPILAEIPDARQYFENSLGNMFRR